MNKLALIFTTCVLCLWPICAVAAEAVVFGDSVECAQIASTTPRLSVVPGGLKIEVVSDATNESFTIYSITGQVVKSFTLNAGVEMVDLPQGCYIIKCSQWSKKVVVR